jgi:GNAT superfamily N-acetyltransferase
MSHTRHNSYEVGIRLLSTPVADSRVAGLVDLLVDAVRGGASISFMWPFERGEAEAFWRRVLAGIGAPGGPVVLVAMVAGRVAGSVQLHPAWPPNQPQRADVAKLLVHSDFRRRGIARALMLELERHALRLGRTLLTLDTVSGSAADRLYRSLGYVECGTIPRYAMMPNGDWTSTTIFYKQL